MYYNINTINFDFKTILNNTLGCYSLYGNKIKINKNMSELNNFIFNTYDKKIIKKLKQNLCIYLNNFSLFLYSKIRKCPTFTLGLS